METFRLRRVKDVAELFDVRPLTGQPVEEAGTAATTRLKALRLAREQRVELPRLHSR